MSERQPLTLSGFAQRLKAAVTGAFPEPFWVIAEVAELNVAASGHCYLTLVEKAAAGIVARQAATCWAGVYAKLGAKFQAATGTRLAAGLKVMLQVAPTCHPVHGLALTVTDIDPAYTLGDLARRRKEIVDRLTAEGLLRANARHQLAAVPQRIAVVSSARAAGLEDFLHQLQHNNYGYVFRLELFEAVMQGEATESSVLAALRAIYRRSAEFDAIVVIRGGGAATDLMWFDNYAIGAAIAHSLLPVIAGIGHEKDETVVDLVAHTRCKTPTAVAEFLLGRLAEFEARILACYQAIAGLARHRCSTRQTALTATAHGLAVGVRRALERHRQTLGRCEQAVATTSRRRLAAAAAGLRLNLAGMVAGSQRRLARAEKGLDYAAGAIAGQSRQILGGAAGRLTQALQAAQSAWRLRFATTTALIDSLATLARLVDPGNVLKRGYAIITRQGNPVNTTAGLTAGEELTAIFAAGSARCTITEVNHD